VLARAAQLAGGVELASLARVDRGRDDSCHLWRVGGPCDGRAGGGLDRHAADGDGGRAPTGRRHATLACDCVTRHVRLSRPAVASRCAVFFSGPQMRPVFHHSTHACYTSSTDPHAVF
jgi:hypothetical protein